MNISELEQIQYKFNNEGWLHENDIQKLLEYCRKTMIRRADWEKIKQEGYDG